MEIVVDQDVPIARAHLAALLDLRYSQQHYIANPPYDFYVFPDVIEREQEQVRTKAELCGIDIPESIDPLQWITSQDVRDHVSYLYVLALRDPDTKTTQQVVAQEKESVDPPKLSVNARMIDALQRKEEAKGWSIRKWMEYIGCKSTSTIQTQPTWKALRLNKIGKQSFTVDDRSDLD